MIWGSRFVELGQRFARHVTLHKQPAAAARQLKSTPTGAALDLSLMDFAHATLYDG